MADLYIDVDELVRAITRTTSTKPADEVVHEVARYAEQAGWQSPTEWNACRRRLLDVLRLVTEAQTSEERIAAQARALGYASNMFGIDCDPEAGQDMSSKVTFTSVPQMKTAVAGSGSHFFDADTMKHWGTGIHGGIIGGHYFITSDWASCDKESRDFRVRWFTQRELHLGMVGNFKGTFSSLDEARCVAQTLTQENVGAEA